MTSGLQAGCAARRRAADRGVPRAGGGAAHVCGAQHPGGHVLVRVPAQTAPKTTAADFFSV